MVFLPLVVSPLLQLKEALEDSGMAEDIVVLDKAKVWLLAPHDAPHLHAFEISFFIGGLVDVLVLR